MVARPFKAGTTTINDCFAERHLMRDRQQSCKKSFMRHSATPCCWLHRFRGLKTAGYDRTSLREERQLRFAVVLRKMKPALPELTCRGPLDLIAEPSLRVREPYGSQIPGLCANDINSRSRAFLTGAIHLPQSQKKGEMTPRCREGISPDKQLAPRNFTGHFGQESDRKC